MATVITPNPSAEQIILDSLSAAGFYQRDGWFYPSGDAGRAAVKICVYNDHFEIWRRRKLNSGWMPIASGLCREFDLASFDGWRRSWPLVH